MLISNTSCVTTQKNDNCSIEKVLNVVANDDSTYYMEVTFNCCALRNEREARVKKELTNKYPQTKDKTLHINEYLGKMYNEYKYEISITN